MSHYTDQNPISEQAWMDSVLNQLGCKATQHKLQKENFTGSKKPEKIEHGPCPDCGKDASFIYYGIDHMGNDDWVTDCSNPRCPSHDHHSKYTR